jgi:glycosyltransferase involved in cell wall biosynthesis
VPRGDAVDVTEVLEGRIDAPIRYRFPLERAAKRFVMRSEDLAQAVRSIVRLFGVGAVHIQHLGGWPITIWRTLRELGLPYVYSVHDFYCVCPNVNLFDVERKRLCCVLGDVVDDDRAACVKEHYAQYGEVVPGDTSSLLATHRAEFQRLLEGARAVFFPSSSARAVVEKCFNLEAIRSPVVPHGYAGHDARLRPEGIRDGNLKLALLGAVSYPTKGADSYLALVARTRDLPVEWHVFGDVTHQGFGDSLRHACAASQLYFHGAYERDEAIEQLREAAIAVVVLLSPWPETFSYALSEALCAGIPAIVSNRGALAERVRGSAAGIVVESVEDAACAIERLIRQPAELERLRAAAQRYRHPSIDEMAQAYTDRYHEMLGRQPTPRPLDVQERRRLLEAHLGVPRGTLNSVAPRPPWIPPPLPHWTQQLPHYDSTWYPYYKPVAPLLPRWVREWARERVASRRWRPVVRYCMGAESGSVTHSSGLEQVPRRRGAAAFRAVNDDPWLVFTSQPFRTAEVRVIRFRMRRRAQQGEFAQLFWTHESGESFSEEKSLCIPLDVGHDSWREYVVWVDRSGRTAQWDDGHEIRDLRLDPLNVPGEFEIGELLLCAREGVDVLTRVSA